MVLELRAAVTEPRAQHLAFSGSSDPASRLTALMSDGVDLRSLCLALRVYQRVGKAIEVKHAKASIGVRTQTLVLDEQVSDTLVLRQEGRGDGKAGLRCVIDCCIAEFSLGIRMNPVGHAMRARTLFRASSPGIMATLPALTSACR